MTTAVTTIKGVELVKVGDWLSGLGKVRITPEDITGAVSAQHDPNVDAAPIKIGHTGALNLGDSLPAAGWVTNLRASADGNTLIGDLANIPYKLASIIPNAYRRRSVEMQRGVAKHGTALTGLALLGAQAPAVKGLKDILDIYAAENPDVDTTAPVDTVTVIVEDGQISLGSDTTPIPPATTEAGDGARVQPTTGQTKTEEGAPVAFIDKLREKAGLPEGATEDEILAALAKAPETTDDKGETTETTEPAATVETEKVAASAGESAQTITLSAGVWTETQSQLRELLTEKRDRQKAQTFDLALSAGKITPAEREAWEKDYDENPNLVARQLDRMPSKIALSEIGSSVAPTADHTAALDAEFEAYMAASGLNLPEGK